MVWGNEYGSVVKDSRDNEVAVWRMGGGGWRLCAERLNVGHGTFQSSKKGTAAKNEARRVTAHDRKTSDDP